MTRANPTIVDADGVGREQLWPLPTALFVDELAAGDHIDAIGPPIAGLFGLCSVAAGFEYAVIDKAVASIADFQSLIP